MGLFRSFSNGMPESLAKEGCISVQKMGNAPKKWVMHPFEAAERGGADRLHEGRELLDLQPHGVWEADIGACGGNIAYSLVLLTKS